MLIFPSQLKVGLMSSEIKPKAFVERLTRNRNYNNIVIIIIVDVYSLTQNGYDIRDAPRGSLA